MGGARSPNYRQGQPQNVTEQYHQFGDKMRQEMSLRGLARALGYSVATLSQHRNAGIFRALPNGKYDMEAVVKGLLASTSPTAEHRTKLETQTVRQTAKSRTWEDWARKLEGAPDVTLPPQAEAGVQAAMKHLRNGKFAKAISDLSDLPVNMARDMKKADPDTSFAGAVAYFENLIAGNLRWAFEMACKGVLK